MNTTTEPQKAPPTCDCREVNRPGCCRGGHRPGKHAAPTRGPAYTRSHELPPTGHRYRGWRWGYLRALRAALTAGDLSREAHAAMLAILDHSDGRGKDCWPSLDTLGDDLGGLAARTVGTHVAELRAGGWVAVKHRHTITADGIQGRSNLYRPLLPAGAVLLGQPKPTPAPTPTPGQAKRRTPAPVPPAVPDEVGPAVELVARWVAALETMAADEVAKLAAERLPVLLAGLRGRRLAIALADAEGPP